MEDKKSITLEELAKSLYSSKIEKKYDRYFSLNQFIKKFLYGLLFVSSLIILSGLFLILSGVSSAGRYANSSIPANSILFCNDACYISAIFEVNVGLRLVIAAIFSFFVAIVICVLLMLITVKWYQLIPPLFIGIALKRLSLLKEEHEDRMDKLETEAKERKINIEKYKKELNKASGDFYKEYRKHNDLLIEGIQAARHGNYYKAWQEVFRDFSLTLNNFFILFYLGTKKEFDRFLLPMREMCDSFIYLGDIRQSLIKLDKLKDAYKKMPKHLKSLNITIWKPFDWIDFFTSPYGIAIITAVLGGALTWLFTHLP